MFSVIQDMTPVIQRLISLPEQPNNPPSTTQSPRYILKYHHDPPPHPPHPVGTTMLFVEPASQPVSITFTSLQYSISPNISHSLTILRFFFCPASSTRVLPTNQHPRRYIYPSPRKGTCAVLCRRRKDGRDTMGHLKKWHGV